MTQASASLTRAGWIGIGLLVLTVYEVGLMGSGRALQFGPLTFRMWLYAAGLIYAAVCSLVKPRVSFASLMLCVGLGALVSMAVWIGASQSANLDYIGEDIKPISYFFLIFFYETVIRTYADVHLVVAALKKVALILCLMYIVVISLVVTKVLNFAVVISTMSSMSDEFVFRGDTGMFIYKGALYIGVGLVFFFFAKGKGARIAAVLCVLAMLATGTRGFIVSLIGTALLYNLFSRGPVLRKGVLGGTAAVLGIVGYALITNSNLHAGSDATRILTLQQVMDRLGFLPLLIGHGFGIGVPERQVHMESTYLEIFHKQGILGLSWWLAVFCLLADRLQRSLRAGNRQLAIPFFLAVTFVFIESWTNPWISNPIGMAVLLLALACLRVLSAPDGAAQPVAAEAYPRDAVIADARATS